MICGTAIPAPPNLGRWFADGSKVDAVVQITKSDMFVSIAIRASRCFRSRPRAGIRSPGEAAVDTPLPLKPPRLRGRRFPKIE